MNVVGGATGQAVAAAQGRSLRLLLATDRAAVSLWLNAGVPATEVADRAGHSVDVLLKRYAKCIDGARPP